LALGRTSSSPPFGRIQQSPRLFYPLSQLSV
jgi:hypothetical protein